MTNQKNKTLRQALYYLDLNLTPYSSTNEIFLHETPAISALKTYFILLKEDK
jgi:hypothetical protein